MALKLSTATVNAMADAAVDLADAGAGANGVIVIYDGAQPADADTAVSTQVALATFQLAATAFDPAVGGQANLAGTPLTTTGDATGTATWFRLYDSDGVAGGDGLLDGAVATTNAELNLNTTSISDGVNVEITSGTFTMPKSA